MAEIEKIQFHRPANNDDFKQTKMEKDVLVFPLLYACSNATAYTLFHPELCDRNGKLNKAGQRECRMFFSHPNNIAYMDAMRAHLEALTKGTVKTLSADAINDSRKDNALKSLLNQAMSLVEKGEDLDAESLKTISEIFKKVGLLKDEVEEQVIKPIRVLPAKCKAECRYRAFVETQVLEGRVFDDCAYCRARLYAEERGFKYDPCKLLDVPQEVIDELDSKNDVKLEQILQGKIEN